MRRADSTDEREEFSKFCKNLPDDSRARTENQCLGRRGMRFACDSRQEPTDSVINSSSDKNAQPPAVRDRFSQFDWHASHRRHWFFDIVLSLVVVALAGAAWYA